MDSLLRPLIIGVYCTLTKDFKCSSHFAQLEHSMRFDSLILSNIIGRFNLFFTDISPEKCEVVIDILGSSINEYVCRDFGEGLHQVVSWFELNPNNRQTSNITDSSVQI